MTGAMRVGDGEKPDELMVENGEHGPAILLIGWGKPANRREMTCFSRGACVALLFFGGTHPLDESSYHQRAFLSVMRYAPGMENLM